MSQAMGFLQPCRAGQCACAASMEEILLETLPFRDEDDEGQVWWRLLLQEPERPHRFDLSGIILALQPPHSSCFSI